MMNRKWVLRGACLTVLLAVGLASFNAHAKREIDEIKEVTTKEPVIVADQIIVKFRDNFQSSTTLNDILKKYEVSTARPMSPFSQEVTNVGNSGVGVFPSPQVLRVKQNEWVKTMRLTYPERTKRAGKDVRTPNVYNTYLLNIKPGSDIGAACLDFGSDRAVEFCQPNHTMQINPLPVPPVEVNDPSAVNLWGLDRIKAREAWNLSTGKDVITGKPIVVAVNDTGVKYDHPDLANNMWVNPGEDLNQNGKFDSSDLNDIDDDNNGKIDDLMGWDFADNDNDPMPTLTTNGNLNQSLDHGTHVAGTIAAVRNNNIGVVGVAPDAKIMALKGFGSNSNNETLNAGFYYAAEKGADVINNSWGCSTPCPSNPAAEEAVRFANSLGLISVFAAGNDYGLPTAQTSPANMNETITVGSVDKINQNAKSAFSNKGTGVDISAPGSSILSTGFSIQPGTHVLINNYNVKSGTSMATPHVVGVIALMLGYNPLLTYDEVLNTLSNTADKVDGQPFNMDLGEGIVNAHLATYTSANTPKVFAQLTSSISIDELNKTLTHYNVTGTAAGADFANYQLSYQFLNPNNLKLTPNWITITNPITTPKTNAVLGVFDYKEFVNKSGAIVVRLTVTSKTGVPTYDYVTLYSSDYNIRLSGGVLEDQNHFYQFGKMVGDKVFWIERIIFGRGLPFHIWSYDIKTRTKQDILEIPVDTFYFTMDDGLLAYSQTNFSAGIADINVYNPSTNILNQIPVPEAYTDNNDSRRYIYGPSLKISDGKVFFSYGYELSGTDLYDNRLRYVDLSDAAKTIQIGPDHWGVARSDIEPFDVDENKIVFNRVVSDILLGNKSQLTVKDLTNNQEKVFAETTVEYNADGSRTRLEPAAGNIEKNLIAWSKSNKYVYLTDMVANKTELIYSSTGLVSLVKLVGNNVFWMEAIEGQNSFASYDIEAKEKRNYFIGYRYLVSFDVNEQGIVFTSIPDSYGSHIIWNNPLQYIPLPAQLKSPLRAQPLSSSVMTFERTANANGTYKLFVGTTGAGSSNIFSGAMLTESLVVPNIPLNGRPLYVRLQSLINGAEINKDYVYQTKVAQPVTWINGVGVTVNSNSLSKTAVNGWGNAGAVSQQIIDADIDGGVDGGVEFNSSTAVGSQSVIVGLSAVNKDNNFNTINYAIHLSKGSAKVFEFGSPKFTLPGTYLATDRFMVERIGSTVFYKKNGKTFYQSATTSKVLLMVDAAIETLGNTINNVQVVGAEIPYPPKAMRVDLSGEGIAIPHAPAINMGEANGDFTGAFWFYLEEGSNGNWRQVMAKGGSGYERLFFLQLRPDNNRMEFRITTTTGYNLGGETTSEIPLNQWVHLAYVKSGNSLALYLNGTLNRMVSLTGTVVPNTGALTIGSRSGASLGIGRFDDVVVYKRALTVNEINALKDSGPKWVTKLGLGLYLAMDEGTPVDRSLNKLPANKVGAIEFISRTQGPTIAPAQMLTPKPGSLLNIASVNFTWSQSVGATEYLLRVRRGTVDIFNGSVGLALSKTIPNIVLDGTNFFVDLKTKRNGVFETRTYLYQTVGLVPVGPSNFTATLLPANHIQLTWVDNATNEVGYKIERSTGTSTSYTIVATTGVGALTYTDKTVQPGTVYNYRIYAYNSQGNSMMASAPSVKTLAVPAAPTALVLKSRTSSSLTMSWKDNATTEQGYKVERSLSVSGPFIEIKTLPANTTTYVDPNLTENTLYVYRVRAYSGVLYSNYTDILASVTPYAIPTAPTGLKVVSAKFDTIELAWQDNASNETGYVIERMFSANGPAIIVTTTEVNVTSYVDIQVEPATTYFYRVKAQNSDGISAASNTVSVKTPGLAIAVPTLKAEALSKTSIKITWPSEASTQYQFKLERSSSMNGPFATVIMGGVDEYTDATGIVPGQTYYYRANYTWRGLIQGAYSPVVSAKAFVDDYINVPTDLTATAQTWNTINLTWTDNATNETGYKVERAPTGLGPFTLIATLGAASQSYSDTTLRATTTYHYRVYAFNNSWSSEFSNKVSVQTLEKGLNPPTNMRAVALSSDSIQIFFKNNESFPVNFALERATNAQGPFALIVTGGADSGDASFIDRDGLQSATTYYYRVQLYASTGPAGDYSSVVSATTLGLKPASPSELTATVLSATSVALNWKDNSNNETGFRVERSIGNSVSYQVLTNSLSANTTTYTDNIATAGVVYNYRVVAYNGSGDSGYAVLSGFTIPIPAAPSNLNVVAAFETSIILSWTDNATTESGFQLERAPNQNGPFSSMMTLLPNTTTYTDANLTGGTTYFYRLRATGASGVYSAYTSVLSVTTLAAVPNAPTGLAVQSTSNDSVTLRWNDQSTNEQGFIVERALSVNGPFTVNFPTASNTTSYVNTGLQAATTYYYRVRSFNPQGYSAYSNTVAATTQNAASSSLPAPSNLVFNSSNHDSIHLQWLAGNITTEDGFTLERATASTGPFVAVGTIPANIHEHYDLNLQPGTYYYRVRAFNSTGSSDPSNVVAASTRAGVLAAPTNLTAQSPTSNSVVLNWSLQNEIKNQNYVIYIERAEALNGPFIGIFTTGGESTTDVTVTAGKKYYYRIYVRNSYETSVFSNVVSVTVKTQ